MGDHHLYEIDLEDLKFDDKIGQGTYGSVWKAQWLSRQMTVAIKSVQEIGEEAKNLALCSHKNIVRFYGIALAETSNFIVTEYASNDSLFNYLKDGSLQLSFLVILDWAKDIAMGVNYLHHEAPTTIIHRDLKSKNVVISDEYICKLCDFGSAKPYDHATNMTQVGTYAWMSPEMLKKEVISEKTDCFSYGVCLWELLTREIPFKDLEAYQIMFAVANHEKRLPIPEDCPGCFADLLNRCWESDPKKRPDFSKILADLNEILAASVDGVRQETESFIANKQCWLSEIRDEYVAMKDKLRDLTHREQQVQDREYQVSIREDKLKFRKLFEMSQIDSLDVTVWSEEDVAFWIHDFVSQDFVEAQQYAETFKMNHITGSRLLSLTEAELQLIVCSVGHFREFKRHIESLKYHQLSYQDFPNLPNSSSGDVGDEDDIETELTILVGIHILPGVTPPHTRWKPYAEVLYSSDVVNLPQELKDAELLVKDVQFKCKFEPYNELTVANPPFILSYWKKGLLSFSKFQCVVTFKDSLVRTPHDCKILYNLESIASPSTERRTVKVSISKRTLRSCHSSSASLQLLIRPDQSNSPIVTSPQGTKTWASVAASPSGQPPYTSPYGTASTLVIRNQRSSSSSSVTSPNSYQRPHFSIGSPANGTNSNTLTQSRAAGRGWAQQGYRSNPGSDRPRVQVPQRGAISADTDNPNDPRYNRYPSVHQQRSHRG